MATIEDEGLVERVQRLTEGADEAAQELVGAVMELYGESLERIVDVLLDAGEAGADIRAKLLDDGVVASVLLIHDLYPVSLEDRVLEALESVRPYMESHGGGVELLGIEDGVAKLRLQGSCDGCPASAATLELAIKEAIEEAAPDLDGLEVEGVVERAPRGPGPARLSSEAGTGLPMAAGGANGAALPMADAPAPAAPVLGVVQVDPVEPVAQVEPVQAEPGWQPLAGVDGLGPGMLTTARAGGVDLVVARVSGALLAYRDACSRCGSSLAAGELRDGLLTCPECTTQFSLPMAGRAFDGGGSPLEPVPLLEDPVRVNVG